MKKNCKKIFIVMCCIILMGCGSNNSTPSEPSNNDIMDILIERYPIINTSDEYVSRLSYFASVAYDRNLCDFDHVNSYDNVNYCKITLTELKKELSDMDVSILETFKDKKCDPEKVSIMINLDNSSYEGIDEYLLVDPDCIDF